MVVMYHWWMDIYQDITDWFEYYGLNWKNRQQQNILEEYTKPVFEG